MSGRALDWGRPQGVVGFLFCDLALVRRGAVHEPMKGVVERHQLGEWWRGKTVPDGGFALASGSVIEEETRMSETLSILSWNVQSPGEYGGSADLEVIVELLKGFGGYDVYGFCEVLGQDWADRFKNALEESEADEFALALGTTGWTDKVLVLYRKSTLQPAGEPEELMSMKEGGGRAPLVVPLRFRSEEKQFLFMMNHLHSSSTSKRIRQVQKLNDWAREQTLPVVAAGDYNFFGVHTTGSPLEDQGFRLLTQDDVFRWVRPKELVQTQFDPHDYTEWILDFVFVAGEAKDWDASAEILLADKPREYFMTATMTDHRPVRASLDPIVW